MISALYRTLARILTRKWHFLGAFLLSFFISLSALVVLGIAPSWLIVTSAPAPFVPATTTPAFSHQDIDPLFESGKGEAPVGIEIPVIGVKANVSNPTSTNVDTLDAALLKGAVRYPTSAKLGENGNIIIFGHSSYLPVVHNQAFKAFNEVAKLTAGEPILVYADGRRYTYAVESVEAANIENSAIPLTVEGAKLTLVTCNSFGDKTDRFIVTAVLVSVASAEAPQ